MTNAERSANAANNKRPKHHNRIRAIMIHLPRYWSMGASVLARDVGVSKSTISHLLRGKSNPLYSTVSRVVKCLEQEIGNRLDPEEIFSRDGSYPTPYVCEFMGCDGCNDGRFYDRDSQLRPGARTLRPGRWTGDNYELEELIEKGGK